MHSLSECKKSCSTYLYSARSYSNISGHIVLGSELKRGPITLKCNNNLLNDETQVDLIWFLYPQILGKYKDVESKQLLWELIIMEIWSKTISYSKRIRAEYKKMWGHPSK